MDIPEIQSEVQWPAALQLITGGFSRARTETDRSLEALFCIPGPSQQSSLLITLLWGKQCFTGHIPQKNKERTIMKKLCV